jgi:hypothetical protein
MSRVNYVYKSESFFHTLVVVNRRRGYQENWFDCCPPSLVAALTIVFMTLLLFWSEGRVDLSIAAQNAVPYPSGLPNDGDLIYTVGDLESDANLSHTLLVPLPVMALSATAQMYSWHELSTSHTRQENDGSETTYYTYSYYTRWSSSPPNSASFETSLLHWNPLDQRSLTFDLSDSKYASEATINGLTLHGVRDLGLPFHSLPLSEELLTDDFPSVRLIISDNYLYIGNVDPGLPSVGDIRVSYSYTPSRLKGLAIGQLSGNNLTSYEAKQDTIFATRTGELRAFYRVDTLEEVVESLRSDHAMGIWLCRIGAVVFNAMGIAVIGDASLLAAGLWGTVATFAVVWIVASLNSMLSFTAVMGAILLWTFWMSSEPSYGSKW